MSDEVPTLTLSAQELWQWAQMFNAVSGAIAQAVARMRERQAERLAASDARDAARKAAARRHPPLRLMTRDEIAEWRSRVPSSLAEQRVGDESMTVVPAQLVDSDGAPTGQWGVEATAWQDEAPVPTRVMLACRDAEDALAMTYHLRAYGTPEHLGYLWSLAATSPVPGEFVQSAPLPGASGPQTVPLVLTEDQWESALRDVLPEHLADLVVVRDPRHPLNSAWRELHSLANSEVWRVGADPHLLAKQVRDVPRWDPDVEEHPAMAHWAITEARDRPTYLRRVVPAPPNVPAPRPGADAPGAAEPAPNSIRDVQTPQQARAWAANLKPANPLHELEAEFGFGRWGTEVDGTLTAKFPKLNDRLRGLAKGDRVHDKKEGDQAVAVITEPAADLAAEQALAEEAARLDPTDPADRRQALLMLGARAERDERSVPQHYEREIAEKFADDPDVRDLLAVQYPNGIPDPDAEATALRARAEADEERAAEHLAQQDDPATPAREDLAAQAQAHGDRAVTATERAAATTALARRQRPVAHRTPTSPPPQDIPRRR
ncbi:hypothetical protein [Amycolatopsis sp. VC5-11]|uniref:hypothetical protein n=1 Tax=Amycolatopsis sp. VC5-11 TaxID=3120156 RepID=UPI00300BA36A